MLRQFIHHCMVRCRSNRYIAEPQWTITIASLDTWLNLQHIASQQQRLDCSSAMQCRLRWDGDLNEIIALLHCLRVAPVAMPSTERRRLPSGTELDLSVMCIIHWLSWVVSHGSLAFWSDQLPQSGDHRQSECAAAVCRSSSEASRHSLFVHLWI